MANQKISVTLEKTPFDEIVSAYIREQTKGYVSKDDFNRVMKELVQAKKENMQLRKRLNKASSDWQKITSALHSINWAKNSMEDIMKKIYGKTLWNSTYYYSGAKDDTIVLKPKVKKTQKKAKKNV